VRFAFKTSPNGDVEVAQAEDLSLFIGVLNDCIGSRAPRGAPSGLSTYWLDAALDEFRRALSEPHRPATFSGNMSYLELVDGLVEARYDYDPPDSDIVERLPLQELVDLLDAWRAEVIRLDPTASTRRPPPRAAIALGSPTKEPGAPE